MPDESKTDLIMHPIRIRILLALVDRKLTPLQLGEQLADVPQATLYRHLNKLMQGGLLEVIEERPVRGTVEKVYGLNQNAAAQIVSVNMENASKDDLMRYFTSFIVSLLADFWRYLQHSERPDLRADGVGFRQIPLYLSMEELEELGREMNPVILKYAKNQPAPGRRRRILTTVMIPTPEGSETGE